jgi:hypothetical protein
MSSLAGGSLAPELMHDPPPYLPTLLLPFLPLSAVPALAAASPRWREALAHEDSWRLLARCAQRSRPVACPPELCGGVATWREMLRDVLLPLRREWAAADGAAADAARAPFAVRVSVRFRPPPDVTTAAAPAADEAGAEGGGGGALQGGDASGEPLPPPPPPPAPAAARVLIPLHQRLQSLREGGRSQREALRRVFRGDGDGGDAGAGAAQEEDAPDPFSSALLAEPGACPDASAAPVAARAR